MAAKKDQKPSEQDETGGAPQVDTVDDLREQARHSEKPAKKTKKGN